MGKQDIIQVLTPDHSIEATFLDEDATIGDLLAALAEDNPIYGNGFWAIVEVAMPRTSALTAETRIKEVQERYQEHLRNPDATIFKLINLQYTLPVVFRHVPTVPESHYRQLHVNPIMTVRQVLDIVIREMGLKALENPSTNGSTVRAPAVSEYIFSQLKVNGEGIEEVRQLTDDESPLDLLLENRELLMNQQINDYHFIFTVPDSWISKVESVTSRIAKGWTATRPLSMAVYGLFGGATSPQQTTAPREISAPIPIATTSIHHPSYGEQDHSTDSSGKSAQRRRQSMIVGSRLSSFFDPASLSGWLQPETKKRHSIVIGQSVPNLILKPFGTDTGAGGPDVNDMTDEELTDAFNALLNDLNIKDTLRESMMNFTREKKAALIMQNQQVQQQRERIASPDPYAVQTGGLPVGGTNPRMNNRNRFIGSISSRVSFIEPDSASLNNNYGSNKLHSRHSSWSSLAGSYYGTAAEENRPPSPKPTGSDRPMSPTMAAAGSLWSSWFGATPLPDADSIDEPADDSPQFYIDQLLSKATTQKTLVKHLLGLRIALATAKLSWIRQFLDGRGFRALESVLEKTAIKKRSGKANDLDETMQSECVQCLRVLMNTEPGFNQVLRSPSLVAHISYCLYTTNSKLRTKVAEVLAALCVMSPESHRLVLMALSDFRVAHEERFRFEYLVQSLASVITGDMDGIGGGSANEHQESFEWEYKTACLSLMNALANSPSSLDDRISLRNELRRRGLEDVFQTLKMQSPPESLLIQINVYEDERHEDWVDLQERAYEAAQFKADQDSQNSELVNIINSLGPADDELYPRIMQTLQQYAEGAVSSLSQEETDDEDQESPDTISRQSLQFKEDLWTIVAKFGERVFQMRDLEKDWAGCQDDFLEGIQHIVGKRGIILSFSDPNLNSSSSASMSSASLASSRRHSFIDYEMDIMRRDMEDMREESDNLRKELAAAKQETEDVKAQLRQQIRSPPLSSRELREGSDSEPPTSYGKRENHAGVVQRLVQKEKEVAQLRETLDLLKKKYNDRAEFVTDDEQRKSERSKEIDSTRWNAMMTEVQVQKSKQTAEAASLADDRQKEIAYLKRALQIVCTRYESAMGERPPAVTEEDHTGQPNQTEGSLQLSKTFEALARKDEEIIELKDEVEKLRKETAVGLTPTEEVLSLRGSLKDVMLRVQELQTLVSDREKTIKGLKETLFTLEAAKHPEDSNSLQGQDANVPGPSRVERSQTRSSLKLQIRALSAKGWQSEEVDEEHEEVYQNGSLSPSTSESNIHSLSVTSPGRLSGITSPKIGQRFLSTGGGRRPALPPPPPPPGPKHKLYAAQAANAPNGTPQSTSASPPPPPPPAQPMVAPVVVAMGPQIVPTQVASTGVPQEHLQAMAAQADPELEESASVPVPVSVQAPKPEPPKINTSAPPPPPPPPFVAAAAIPRVVQIPQTSFTAAIQSSGGAPVPPPPPPFVAAPQPSFVAAPAAALAGPPMSTGPPPPPPPPPFLAGPAPVTTTPAEPLLNGLQRSVSMPTPKPNALAASPPTGGAPPPPPPPMPNAPFGKGVLKPPSQSLPPPPPPGPQPQGAAALEGAIPTLPVFLPGNRTANPLKPLAMAIPQVVKPTRPMKQLFWNKLPTGTITNTVWKDICDPSSDLGTVELDFAEIDELFCKNQTAASNANSAKEKKKPVSLFNVNRANNIAIMLSRIKMPYPEIRAALMEILDDKLSIENLKAIKQYVPTGDEIELIKEFDGDFESLGHADKFYREIYDIPRLSERVSSMIFRRRLEIDVGELKPEMDVLRLTIEELHSSRRLKSLLKTVLLIGNHLNATSFRGNAYGFQLDALLKIRDTKGVDNIKPGASTLLHYLAKSIHSKDPSLLKFLEEVPHLEAAARISVPTLMNSCNSLIAGMNQIREEIRVLRHIRISPPNDCFIDIMEKFADANEEGIQKIVELGQGLEQDLKKLLIFYGEDPVNTKPEDFFGMLVSFSTMLQKSQLENEAMAKKLLSKSHQQQQQQANRSKVGTAISVAAIRDGHLDDAIRGLRSGLRRNRKDRPMSHLYSELSMEALQAINLSVPRAGALTHSRQSSRQ
ncbi:hypothetical protein BGZ95_007390 [Linnemannia exigua]|uniref:Actin-binding FH2 n=1 Tax=Linnemannia exigua TaxID=604196 RepID=A0AAD4DFN8_9FUNG|nr:hypothetical protein BGZ95_007390 [Linnemannia exigua]